MDYDAHDNYIYFSQVNSKKISRVKKGSTEVEDLMAPSMNSSEKMYLFSINNQLTLNCCYTAHQEYILENAQSGCSMILDLFHSSK